jgi:hypothetical protein
MNFYCFTNEIKENKQLKIEQREDIPLFLLNFFKKQTKISKVEFDLLYCFEGRLISNSIEQFFKPSLKTIIKSEKFNLSFAITKTDEFFFRMNIKFPNVYFQYKEEFDELYKVFNGFRDFDYPLDFLKDVKDQCNIIGFSFNKKHFKNNISLFSGLVYSTNKKSFFSTNFHLEQKSFSVQFESLIGSDLFLRLSLNKIQKRIFLALFCNSEKIFFQIILKIFDFLLFSFTSNLETKIVLCFNDFQLIIGFDLNKKFFILFRCSYESSIKNKIFQKTTSINFLNPKQSVLVTPINEKTN